MKYFKYKIVAFIAVILLGVPWLINTYPNTTQFIDTVFSSFENNFAAVITRNVITMNQLQEKYKAVSEGNPKVHIMIVPGHEPDYGGTEFDSLKERDLNVQLAKDLQSFFEGNDHYEITLARDKNTWNSDLKKYFNENWSSIKTFSDESKKKIVSLVKDGGFEIKTDGVYHNSARKDVVLRLYGINKWVNENKIDIAIHIHFNDYPRKNISKKGEYSGIAIYVPEKQYSNSLTTRTLADAVFKRLIKYSPSSNLPKENIGVIEDQDLIAIGSNNTVDAPSMLIEYGYIYETQYADQVARDLIIKDLAFQTYLGIQDSFGSGNDVSFKYDTLLLPYNFKEIINKNSTDKESILALQTAFLLEGLYPDKGDTKKECPRTGRFDPCTLSALESFQKKYNISGEGGIVGKKTLEVLNSKYSIKVI